MAGAQKWLWSADGWLARDRRTGTSRAASDVGRRVHRTRYGLGKEVGPREFSEQIYERALGYRWARPAKSFLLTGEQVQPFDEVPAEVREEVLSGLAGGDVERYPLLSFGSNGDPETLSRSVFGDTASARDLVTRVMEDFSTAASTIGPVLRETARPFESERWTPFPASAT